MFLGRRPLLRGGMLAPRRPLLRAGLLAGTAYAARKSGERQTEAAYAEADQDQRLGDLEAGGSATPAAGGSDVVDQLAKLKSLADSGALSDEEFRAAKAKLLA